MTDTQRATALEHAHQIKLAEARLRKTIELAGSRDGALHAARIVRAGESTMTFKRLLQAIPRVGDVHARYMLAQARIDGSSRIDSTSVGAERRQLLIGALLHHAHRNRPA